MKKKGNTWTAEDRERWIRETMAIINEFDDWSSDGTVCSDINIDGGYLGGCVIC